MEKKQQLRPGLPSTTTGEGARARSLFSCIFSFLSHLTHVCNEPTHVDKDYDAIPVVNIMNKYTDTCGSIAESLDDQDLFRALVSDSGGVRRRQ